MLKPILLASAMMISAPALAQDASGEAATSPQSKTTAPAQDATAAESAPADTATPQESAAPADPAQQSADAAPASGQPQQASATQIAQIVETEFPNYDGDKDGQITKDEFGKWMVALRSASEPGTNAESAEVKTWIGNAFATADTDKSAKVSKTELTSFLSKGAS